MGEGRTLYDRWLSHKVDEELRAHQYLLSDSNDDKDEQLEIIDLGYGEHGTIRAALTEEVKNG